MFVENSTGNRIFQMLCAKTIFNDYLHNTERSDQPLGIV